MHIQKIGPDCVLIIAQESELDGGLEDCARMALSESGIEVNGRPSCAAYTAGGETLLFARAVKSPVLVRFDSAAELIDAARMLRGRVKNQEIFRMRGGYIGVFQTDSFALCEYGEKISAMPEAVSDKLDAAAWERLGK